jgi:predicted permease
LLAEYGARSFGKLHLPINLPLDFSISLDYRALLFSIGLSFFTGILSGLAPALYAVRQDVISGLKNQAHQPGLIRWWRLRNLLVVSQVAISTLLLTCAGLFFRSLEASKSADTGMANRNVALIGFDPFLERGSIERERILAEVLRRAKEIPGVRSAALTSTVPLSLAGVSGTIGAEDKRGEDKLKADIYEVSSGFFETLGIPFIAGEDFTRGEFADVVILNKAAADRLFPAGNSIGSRVQNDDKGTARVIGVVANSKSRSIAEEPRPCIYKPLSRGGEINSITGLTLLLRTAGDPDAYLAPASAAVRDADKGIAVLDIRTMDQHLADALMLRRAGTFLLGLAGIIGLVIAAVGLYGVVSFMVARQMKDIGVRMALGARRAQILADVLLRGLGLTITGAAIGLALAAMLSSGIGGLLYRVRSTDPVTLIAVPLFLLATALAACVVPALHAANAPPAITIRHE